MLRVRRLGLGAAAALVLAVAGGCGSDGSSGSGGSGGPLKVSGSTTVNPVAADAAAALKGKLEVLVDASGGSAGGIAQLSAGEVQIAMTSKEVADEDRQKAPDVDFQPEQIGADAVGIVTTPEVVEGGVKSLDRAQLTRLFEGKVRNWRELGGPDLDVFIYDKEPGRGTREVLDKFLYGDDGKAPPPPDSAKFAIVGGNEETRTKIASTPGAVGPLSSAFAEGREDLAVIAVDGVAPEARTIEDGSYPLARPLFLVTDGAPEGDAKTFIDYVLSAPGQKLVTKHGYVTMAQLGGSGS